MFHMAGGLQMARWVNRKGLRILMYHRFSDRADLEIQCRHIREHYFPVSMTQVDTWLKSGDPLPDNSIAITIDDGYQDFAEVGYPAFSSWGIPVTVYLVADFLDGREWLWVDRVKYAFLHSPLDRVRIDLPGERAFYGILGAASQRRAAAAQLCEQMKLLRNEVRLAALAALPEVLQVAIPAAPPAEFAPLAWEDVRRMAASGVGIGAHTKTHPVLSRISGEGELHDEIGGSKQRIEEALGFPVEHFCYPNGSDCDITPECVEAVRLARFRTAVTTRSGLNYPAGDRFLLRRIGVDPGFEPLYFQRCAAAFRV